MERILRSAWQLKPGDLLITADTYTEFDHPKEISGVRETGPDVRVDFTEGALPKVFNRMALVFIVDTFRSPEVTALTKPCAECGTPISKDSVHSECRYCRTRAI